ncbi:hypothetical protein DMENIID0001_062830 [Sergentomyia squamirostris]
MKNIVLILVICVLAVKAKQNLKEFSLETEKFQNQINHQIRKIQNGFSYQSSGELIQIFLTVDETMNDMENLKMGISNMMEMAGRSCVDGCPTKYEEALQEADAKYHNCLRAVHAESEAIIRDFQERTHRDWRQRNDVQISKLSDLFQSEVQGQPTNYTIEVLKKEVKSSSLQWDNEDIVELTKKEAASKTDLQGQGMSTFTCFLIVRNGLFGKVKEIEAYLNDNCFKDKNPQILVH